MLHGEEDARGEFYRTRWRPQGRDPALMTSGIGKLHTLLRWPAAKQRAPLVASPNRIAVRISRVEQLFNSLDPSPFHEKDLDREAESYIADSADEFPLTRPLILVIEVPKGHIREARSAHLAEAIHNYFAYRLSEARRRLHFLFREGRISLAIGLAFLAACMTIREFIAVLGQDAPQRILGEGLLILGWVAMWRPLQIFLYEWWPLRHGCRLFEKLTSIPVEIMGIDGSETPRLLLPSPN
jgi:hypothetical protein